MFNVNSAIAIFLGSLFMYLGTLKSAAAYHSKMLRRILHAPMSFFDTTPMGRIVNRFSKDIDTLDTVLPLNIKWWIVAAFKTLATIFVISYSTPFIILGLIPILFLFFIVQVRNFIYLNIMLTNADVADGIEILRCHVAPIEKIGICLPFTHLLPFWRNGCRGYDCTSLWRRTEVHSGVRLQSRTESSMSICRLRCSQVKSCKI